MIQKGLGLVLFAAVVVVGTSLSAAERVDITKETCFHKEMRCAYPKFRKVGAVCGCGESSPFVFKGRRMRLELDDPSRGADVAEKRINVRIRDMATNKILSSFGAGCYYPSAMVDGERVCVTATKRTYYLRGETEKKGFVDGFCGETVMLFESTDLVHWSSRELFTRPGYRIYNTTMTKGPEGYVIAYECKLPDCVPFTMLFAKSPDLKAWTHLKDSQAYPAQRYCGGPFLHYHNGYYYLSLVTALPCVRYCTYLFRTKDFVAWDVGRYNPFLNVTQDDRQISPTAVDLPDDIRRQIPTAFVCSLADVEMCEVDGKTWLVYGIGDQMGFYYLAEAWYDGPMGELLENFFK